MRNLTDYENLLAQRHLWPPWNLPAPAPLTPIEKIDNLFTQPPLRRTNRGGDEIVVDITIRIPQ